MSKPVRNSARIADMEMAAAVADRPNRIGRGQPPERFVPGAADTTSLVYDATLGKQVLHCPATCCLSIVRGFVYRGTRNLDFAALGAAPAGQVWHHHHDYDHTTNKGSMYLIRVEHHLAGHHGGVYQWKQSHPGMDYV
ncbi:hypothetical protein E4631_22315 [Hymenobacter sp. UV11]|uniref:HNH endonuclease n=1 Tax=Hymenobacter sp. UV11 TaxID=1849735 RepID=UPI00105F758F|nr:HNH endonuclease [Hymenobacter sp. UV11]TFZ63570.1 hypothetical protein E4631_22315 [Hymenobacter sp. UV11]